MAKRVLSSVKRSLSKKEAEEDFVPFTAEEDEDDDTPVDATFLEGILDRSGSVSSIDSPMKKSSSEPKIIDTSKVNLGQKRSVKFSGVDSEASSKADEDKDNEELMNKIQDLQLALKQAQLDLSAEKTMRKKKERNLIKLAKELNKRKDETGNKAERVIQLEEQVAVLESKLSAVRQEMEDRSAEDERLSREQHAEITVLQKKYRKTCREHDAAIEKLNKTHVEQTEDLRREILAANLTADRFRSQLARLEMAESPENADEIVKRTIRASISKPSKRDTKFWILLGVSVVAAVGYQLELLSVDALCAPAMPGTKLDKDDASFEAPWWAPESVKSRAFAICGERSRTRLTWTVGYSGYNKLSVVNLDGADSKVLLDKRTASAVVHPKHITAFDKKGNGEDSKSPWSL